MPKSLKAVGDPDVRRKLEDLGFAVRGSSAEELGAMTREQLAKYARVIKEMGHRQRSAYSPRSGDVGANACSAMIFR